MSKHEHRYSHSHEMASHPVDPTPVDPNLHYHISRFTNAMGIVYIAERTHSHGWAGIPGDPHDHAFAPWNMEPTGEVEQMPS